MRHQTAADTDQQFLRDVQDGLRQPRKTLPCKYFYDAEGSRLFDRICELDEYYPTRTELGIMRDHAPEMARRIGPRCVLIEPGSGSSLKTRLLLDELQRPVAYVPVDISEEHLRASADALDADYPDLRVIPVCADFTSPFELPPICGEPSRRVVYFPGSTIGNFHPAAAGALLTRLTRLVGAEGGVLIGIDLKKDMAVLERAYNDAEGVTAAFNLNLLARINRELDGDFDLEQFAHRAFYDREHGRIEMHLESLKRQTIRVAGESFRLNQGETIRTECSYKYDLAAFTDLARTAGLQPLQRWTDSRQYFAVLYLALLR